MGIKVGSDTLTIRADSCGTGGYTWLNDEEIAVGDALELGTDLKCSQTSTRQYKCKTNVEEFKLIIDMYEGHLAVQAWSNNCRNARGLLGSCGSDGAANDFFDASNKTLDVDTELNVKNIYEKFAVSLQPSKTDSMFSVVLPNSIPSSAETCLRSAAGHAISEPISTFTEAQVTIEIKFYLETVDADCATLWSYHSEKTFSVLVCDRYVNIYFNSEKTEIKALNRIKSHTWYHLSTSWNNAEAELNFFLVFYSGGSKAYEIATEAFGESPLIPGGIFMLGQMYYDTSMNLEVIGWSFDGYFDEFTIWKNTTGLEKVLSNAFAYKEVSEIGLSNLWRFNEGYDTTSLDSSELQLRMNWVTGPRSHPEWSTCGYTMEYPVLSQLTLTSLLDTYKDAETETTCLTLLEKTGLKDTLTEAAWLKLNQQCQFNIYSHGSDIAWAREVIKAVVDAYMVTDERIAPDVRASTDWPGKTLCHDFGDVYFHGWTGDSCEVYCLSGDYNTTTGQCLCGTGYWSSECDQICPSARNSPCGGGTCDEGVCTCTLDRYDAAEGCKKCSNGWSGGDCSSAPAHLSTAVKRMGSSFALGHTIMFDGQGYDIHTPGQYILMETSSIGLYMRMKPRGSNVVIQQLWLHLAYQEPAVEFTIQTPLIDNEDLIFWQYDENVQIVDSHTITDNVELVWEDQTSLKIDLSHYSDPVIKVTYLGSYLDIQVIYESTSCSGTIRGLLGNCDSNLDNDFYASDTDTIAYFAVTQDDIDTSFVDKFRKTETDGFKYSYPDLSVTEPVSIDNGYSLFFNEWGIRSRLVPEVVFGGSKNITFDIKMKPLSDNGLILGYESDHKFSIFMEDLQLKFWLFNNKYNTSFVFEKDTWSHLFLAHDISTNNITLSIFVDRALIHQEDISLPPFDFTSGGYFLLGYWQVKPPTDFGAIVGMFGTFRVWDKILDDYVMFDASITQIVAGYENLVLLFDFNEGVGLTVSDSVNGLTMGLPRTGEVTWFITDLPQVPKASQECKSETTSSVSASTNRETCTEWLQKTTVLTSCEALGSEFVASYFYDACLTDDSYVPSLKVFVDMCMTVVTPPSSPIIEICADGTVKHYKTVCAEFCKFGTPSKSGCTCHRGYWGDSCDSVCPGGSDNPCYGHGICDVKTGVCGCFSGFSTPDKCEICQPMYMAPTCEMRYPPSYDPADSSIDDTKVSAVTQCKVLSVGSVINFMELTFEFKHVGQYYLIKPDEMNPYVPDLQMCTTTCFSGRTCITSVYLNYKDEFVTVQGAATSTGEVMVTVNDTIQYSSTAQIDFLSLEVTNPKSSEYVLESQDGEIIVEVSHSTSDARYLTVSVTLANSKYCEVQESICGNCVPFTGDNAGALYDEAWVVPNGDRCTESTAGGTDSSGTSGTGGTGGFAVCFADTSETEAESEVRTNILNNVITNVDVKGLTISFKIKPGNDTGTIFSYSEYTSFAAFLEGGILKVAVGSEIDDTGIPILMDEWTHVSLAWTKDTQQMIVYSTSLSANDTETLNHILSVPEEAFNNYGTLTLGSFTPPFDPTVEDPISQDYIGCLDEFFILQTALEASEEAKYRTRPVPLDEEDLVLLFDFDNVEDNVIPDRVSDDDLRVVTDPWVVPSVTYEPSDLPIESVPPDEVSDVAADSTDALVAAVEECDQYFTITELDSLCEGYVNIQMYKDMCVSIMEATGDPAMALEAGLEYARTCLAILEKEGTPTENPLSYFCKADPAASGFVGKNCDIPCVFPDLNGDGLTCVCARGYWGTKCDEVCPGGAETPCNNKGVCDQDTGGCQCLYNYQGDTCNECSSSWLGSDCNVIVQPNVPGSVSDFYSCSLISNNYLGIFDGSFLTLDTKVDGTFVMYQDAMLKIDLQIGPCSMYDKCVLAVAFGTNGNIVTIVPQETGTVTFSGTIDMVGGSFIISSQYTLTNPSTTVYILEGPVGFYVDVTVQPSFLNIFIKSPTCPDASNSIGICGGCAKQSSDSCSTDLCVVNTVGIAEAVSINNDLETDILKDFFQQSHMDYTESLFAAAGESQLTSGYGVSLETENGYISFQEDVFGSTNGSKAIEMRAKIDSADGGTVFSYYTDETTFGIVIENGQFVLQYGTDTFPTGIAVAEGEWSNIAISYDETTGQVRFDYIYGDDSVHSYKVFDETEIDATGLFTDGKLVVGQWMGRTTTVQSNPPDGFSSMTVDRLLTWDKALSPTDCESNWNVNIFSELDGLTTAWNFDEGTETETTDSLTGRTATIDQSSSWSRSEVNIVPESAQVTDTADIVVSDLTAEKICDDLKTVLTDHCGELASLLDQFYLMCFNDVSQTRNPDDSIDAALWASDMCSGELGIEAPLKSSCNDFPTRDFPDWVGDVCSDLCYHGTFTNEDGCVCNEGYYGGTCSEPCPGGPVPPCNGHGSCTTAGQCDCLPNWSGDNTCSSCTTGYSGSTCEKLVVQPPSDCAGNTCSMVKGKVTRMDCTRKKYDDTKSNLTVLALGTLRVSVSMS